MGAATWMAEFPVTVTSDRVRLPDGLSSRIAPPLPFTTCPPLRVRVPTPCPAMVTAAVLGPEKTWKIRAFGVAWRIVTGLPERDRDRRLGRIGTSPAWSVIVPLTSDVIATVEPWFCGRFA